MSVCFPRLQHDQARGVAGTADNCPLQLALLCDRHDAADFRDRRCSADELTGILRRVPLNVRGPSLRLSGRMGLGRIIYLRPEEGEISSIRVNGLEIEPAYGDRHLVFNYDGRRFYLDY